MGLDYLIYKLSIPVLILCLLLLVSFLWIGKPWQSFPPASNHVSVRRCVLAISGATLGTLLSIIFLGEFDLGNIIYLSIILIPITWVVSIFMGIPSFILLARYGQATLMNILFIMGAIILLWSGFIYIYPYNNWCSANTLACLGREMSYAIPLIGIPSLGFGLMARLSFIKQMTS